MSTVYPSSKETFTTHVDNDPSDLMDAGDLNPVQDTVAAIEDALGFGTTDGILPAGLVAKNATFYKGKNAAGTAKSLLGMDANDHFVLGQARRKGGDASEWSTVGTTAYTGDKFTIQCGAVLVGRDGTNSYGTAVAVTFPTAFSDVPILYAVAQSGSASANKGVFVASITVPTASGFNANIHFVSDSASAENPTWTARAVNWIAVGPIA